MPLNLITTLLFSLRHCISLEGIGLDIFSNYEFARLMSSNCFFLYSLFVGCIGLANFGTTDSFALKRMPLDSTVIFSFFFPFWDLWISNIRRYEVLDTFLSVHSVCGKWNPCDSRHGGFNETTIEKNCSENIGRQRCEIFSQTVEEGGTIKINYGEGVIFNRYGISGLEPRYKDF